MAKKPSTRYMEMKKTHKMSRYKKGKDEDAWSVRTECKMQNKSASYKWSTYWENVDCQRCLAKRSAK